MSLEESINILTSEIKQLSKLLQLTNQLLEKPPVLDKPPKLEKITRTKRMLTEKVAAEYIGMSQSFLRQDRMNGHRQNRTKGPNATKVGRRRILYDIEELNRWLGLDDKRILNIIDR